MAELVDHSGKALPNGENGAIPWQIKAVVTLGVPSVIALWLVWTLTQTIGPTVTRIEGKIDGHVIGSATLTSQTEAIIRVLRANCVNQAATNADRERCFQ